MSALNDMTRIVRESSKTGGSNKDYAADPKIAAQSLIRRHVTISLLFVNANGANTTSSIPLVGAPVAANANPTQWRAPHNYRVLTCHFVPSAASTADGANNATIAAVKSPANGAAGLTVATANTNTTANGGVGTLAAGAPVALTVTDIANARGAKGTVLSGTITQNASGVLVGSGALVYLIEMEGPCDDVGI